MNMTEAAVIGNPVSHSYSPAIFQFLAHSQGLAAFRYSAIQVLPSELGDFMEVLRKKGRFLGVNITLPHKQPALSQMDELSPEARAIGAVNVVHAHEGRLSGYNTDVLGVLRTLEEQRCRVQDQSVWLYGAGGAARAAAYALGAAGAKQVFIQNRTATHTQTLVQQMGQHFPETRFWAIAENEYFAHPLPAIEKGLSLLIHATSFGMKGGTEDSAIFSNMERLPISDGALAFDLIYNPQQTVFLERAKACGHRGIGGLDMLIYQALETWKIWMGKESLSAEKVVKLKEELGEYLGGLLRESALLERPIFLTGFMGVGKSSVGSLLARRLGWEFVDTDQLIVRAAGMSIPRIFSELGEQVFRRLESAAVQKALAMSRVVVALGGGTLMSPESLLQVKNGGRLVYLKASVDSLFKRLEHTAYSRPLLSNLDPVERRRRIETLFETRQPVYEQALVQIQTDGRGPDQIAQEIVTRVSTRPLGEIK